MGLRNHIRLHNLGPKVGGDSQEEDRHSESDGEEDDEEEAVKDDCNVSPLFLDFLAPLLAVDPRQ